MKHILIIGGTGMLRQASTHFIEQGHIVTMMACSSKRLNSIKGNHPRKQGKILTIPQDYQQTKPAIKWVKTAADMYVHIDMAILWIHSTGGQFSEEVKEFLLSHHPKTKVWQLWGSSTVNPVELSQKKWLEQYPDRYREIFLGYKTNGKSTRWLTNREISEGTIKAINSDHRKNIVGKINPWDLRP